MNTETMTVKLSSVELMTASLVGLMRSVQSITSGRNAENAYANRGDNWQRDVEGACAEMALAKALGRYYAPTVNNFDGTDACGYQVRSTRYRDGKLIIREKDKDDDIFVLVVGERGKYEIKGYILGADAKEDIFLVSPEEGSGNIRNGGPAWFVPQDALYDPFMLKF